VTLGVLPTLTVGVLLMFTVLPAAKPTVPATLVVPCAAAGTGCPVPFTTTTFWGLLWLTAGTQASVMAVNRDTTIFHFVLVMCILV